VTYAVGNVSGNDKVLFGVGLESGVHAGPPFAAVNPDMRRKEQEFPFRNAAEITIDAPVGSVYDVVVDPSRLTEWVTIHDSLEGAPDRPLERGSELTQVLRIAGRTFRVRWTVVENDPCRRVVWQGRGPLGSHACVVYRFDSDDVGRETTFSYTNEYELPGGPFARMAGLAVSVVAQKELDDSLQRLKTLVQRGSLGGEQKFGARPTRRCLTHGVHGAAPRPPAD
jgi:uncharacterized membrane protein